MPELALWDRDDENLSFIADKAYDAGMALLNYLLCSGQTICVLRYLDINNREQIPYHHYLVTKSFSAPFEAWLKEVRDSASPGNELIMEYVDCLDEKALKAWASGVYFSDEVWTYCGPAVTQLSSVQKIRKYKIVNKSLRKIFEIPPGKNHRTDCRSGTECVLLEAKKVAEEQVRR